jgi:hypothetical protein
MGYARTFFGQKGHQHLGTWVRDTTLVAQEIQLREKVVRAAKGKNIE